MRFKQLKENKSTKLHYKLHKVGKSWVTIGMATVGMATFAGVMGGNQAHADSKAPDVSTTAVADQNHVTNDSKSDDVSTNTLNVGKSVSNADQDVKLTATPSTASDHNSSATSNNNSSATSNNNSSATSNNNSSATSNNNSSATSNNNSSATSNNNSSATSNNNSSATSNNNSSVTSNNNSSATSNNNSSATSNNNSSATSNNNGKDSGIPVDSTTYNYASTANNAAQSTSQDVHSASAYTSGGSALNSMVNDGSTRIDSMAAANPNNPELVAIAKSAATMKSTTNSLYARQSGDLTSANSYAKDVYAANSVASQMNILVAVASAKANSASVGGDQSTATSASGDVTKGQSLANIAAQNAVTGQSHVNSLMLDTQNVFKQLTSYNVSPLYSQAASTAGININGSNSINNGNSSLNMPASGTGDFYVSTAVQNANATNSVANVANNAYNGLTSAASDLNAISNVPQSVIDDTRQTAQQGYNANMNAQSQASVADMSVQVANNANTLARQNAAGNNNSAALSDVSIAASAAATASSAYIQATNQASLALSAQSHVQSQRNALLVNPNASTATSGSSDGLIDPMNFSNNGSLGGSTASDQANADSAMISVMGSAVTEGNMDYDQAGSIASAHVNNKYIQENYTNVQTAHTKMNSANADAQAIYGRLASAVANQKQQQEVASNGYQRAQSASAVQSMALQKGDKQTASQAGAMVISYVNAARGAEALAQKQGQLIDASRKRINDDGQIIANVKKDLTQSTLNMKNERYAVTGGHQYLRHQYVKINRGIQVTNAGGQTQWLSVRDKPMMKLISSRRLANGQIQDTAIYRGERVTFVGNTRDVSQAYYQNSAFKNRSSFYVKVANSTILEHTSANFNTGHVKAYRPGKMIHVVGLTHYHGITRFVLANGHYITANKYLVAQV